MSLLELIPYGEENAITRGQLARLTGRPDRVNRKEIERLRGREAILNLQSGDGYFRPRPEDTALVRRWYAQQSKRGRSVQASTLGAKLWLEKEGGVEVVVVREHLRRKRKPHGKQIEGQVGF